MESPLRNTKSERQKLIKTKRICWCTKNSIEKKLVLPFVPILTVANTGKTMGNSDKSWTYIIYCNRHAE